MSKAAADARYEGRSVTYLFASEGELVIDGFGTAMFLNHCCDPNCETEQDENGRIFISTIRDVAAGEELTYEYNLHDSDEDDAGLLLRRLRLPQYHVQRPGTEAARTQSQAQGRGNSCRSTAA